MVKNEIEIEIVFFKAFCAFISAELKEVHCLLAVLESQVNLIVFYFIFLISYFTLFHILNIKWIQQLNNNAENNTTESNLSLRRLSVWLDQPFDRLKYLNIVCDAVKGKKQQEAQ